MNQNLIYIAIHSLKYEPFPSQFDIVTREQYWRMKKSKMYDKFVQRYGPNRWRKERDQSYRELLRTQYSKRIQEKYNVGPDWMQNRWFVEQVRPTL
jgi:hypothetical protein